MALEPPFDPRIDRRRFLQVSLATGGSLALGCAFMAGEEPRGNPPPTAVDAHIHLWSANQRDFPRAPRYEGMVLKPRRYEARDFLALAAMHGIGRAVVIQAGCYEGDHTYLRSVIASHPDHFAGVGTVDFGDDPAATLHALADAGLHGARLSLRRVQELSNDRGRIEALLEAAGDRNVPICLKTNPELFEGIARACERHPRVTFVLDHAGNPAPGVQETQRLEDLQGLAALGEHENVYVKISGFHMLGRADYYELDVLPLLYRAVEVFGPNRLMWGSDAPQQHRNDHRYVNSLQLIRGARELSEEDRAWILHKTADRIFFPSLPSLEAEPAAEDAAGA